MGHISHFFLISNYFLDGIRIKNNLRIFKNALNDRSKLLKVKNDLDFMFSNTKFIY